MEEAVITKSSFVWREKLASRIFEEHVQVNGIFTRSVINLHDIMEY